MRIARGFSQERLGEAMGISFQAVQKHEAGRTKWSVARALQYAEILNVKVEDIFRGTDVFAERDVKPIELELSQKAIELAMMHDAIVDPAQQAALRNLARTMAKAED